MIISNYFIYILTIFSTLCIIFSHICFKGSLNNPSSLISLFYQFSLAIITSFIFWFVLVNLKEKHDTKNVEQYIIPKTKSIIGDGYKIFNEMAKKAGYPETEFPPSEDELKKILEKINPNVHEAPLVSFNLKPYTWIEYLDSYRLRSQDSIKKILDRIPYLNTDLMLLLDKIDENSYFIQLSYQIPMNNKDMAFFSTTMMIYFKGINDLSLFLENIYKEKMKYDEIYNINRINAKP